ncbi:MAG: hypothetical protein HKN09_13845 [Saprospiraceae bacterium]|nr:hypothetical protein [Saprospiraceae bacterium]
MKIKYIFLASLAMVFIVAILLITGSPLLTLPTPGLKGVPLGTFITWVGLMSLPYAIFWGSDDLRNPKSKLERSLNILLISAFIMAVLWIPVSYLLAGNMSFNFTEKASFQGGQSAMRLFWTYTYCVVGFPILILLLFIVLKSKIT